jgi:hypothetical protein
VRSTGFRPNLQKGRKNRTSRRPLYLEVRPSGSLSWVFVSRRNKIWRDGDWARFQVFHLRTREVDNDAVLSVLQPIWQKILETASRLRGRIEAVLTVPGFRSTFSDWCAAHTDFSSEVREVALAQAARRRNGRFAGDVQSTIGGGRVHCRGSYRRNSPCHAVVKQLANCRPF